MTTNASATGDDDVWCERRMWAAAGIITPEIGLAEPFACLTGLAICCIAVAPLRAGICRCVPPRLKLPHRLTTFRAALFLFGLGTACFHAVTHRRATDLHLNPALFDFYPLVLVTMHLMLLYVHSWSPLIGVLMVWGCAVVVALDSATFDYWDAALGPGGGAGQGTYGSLVNAIFLMPVAITLVYATACVYPAVFSLRVWGLIAVATTLWLLDAYLCALWLPLALGHGLYHLIMAYVFLITACHAMPPDRWTVRLAAAGGWWPQVTCARCCTCRPAETEFVILEFDETL